MDIQSGGKRLFTAKDISKYIGISKSQLYHASRVCGLVKPKIKAEGRAFKDKYSFTSLLDLALIEELKQFGFEPGHIKAFVNPFPKSSDAPEEWKGSVWNYFKAGKKDHHALDDFKEGLYTVPGYEKAGFLLLIFKHEGKYKSYRGTNDQVLDFIKDFNLTIENKGDSTNLLIINLLKIKKELEKETGESL